MRLLSHQTGLDDVFTGCATDIDSKVMGRAICINVLSRL
jgi:hypothetical protein